MIKEITEKFVSNSTPGKGSINFDQNYDKTTHPLEVSNAEWLHSTFGGSITLLAESTQQGTRTPDYEWNDRFWEGKNLSTNNTATIDYQVRKASQQISEKSGGILLDFSTSKSSFSNIISMVCSSADRRVKEGIPIIIKKHSEFKVYTRTKK